MDQTKLRVLVIETISELTEKNANEIATDVDLSEYGVDSIVAATISDEISRVFNIEINDLEHFVGLSTIDDIVDYFSTELA
ncbi:MAG: acyl carrier protein [Pseudomonadales bacterium]|nr:acyl carrier protein [Pseudomonadales bacterium]